MASNLNSKPITKSQAARMAAQLRPARGVAPLAQPSGKTTIGRNTPATGARDNRPTSKRLASK